MSMVGADYDQILANLKNFLRNQNTLQDYDMEGSTMSILLSILAENDHFMAFMLNAVGNESFLDTAQQRSSVVSLSKALGYVPASQKSSSALVNIIVTPSNLEDNDQTTLTLPRFTNFQSQAIDGTNYNFVTASSNVTTKNANNQFLFSNVTLNQGDIITTGYLVDGSRELYPIPSANVDTNYVWVSVQASPTNTAITTYSVYDDLTDLSQNTNAFFIQENSDANGTYSIYFGDGVLGTKPANNSVVTITYLNTNGKYANKANAYILLGSINGFNDNVKIIPVTQSSGGADREPIHSVRYRAPRFDVIQNRAVTVNDYIDLISRDYPHVDAISVWGGADNDPPVYGQVFISLKPVDYYEISDNDKNQIINDIIARKGVMTVTPVIVDPDVTYVQLKIQVNYDPAKTNLDEGQLTSMVANTVVNYRNTDLHTFNSVFRKSKLSTLIDETEPSITSSSMQVFLQKRLFMTPGEIKNYTMQFLTPVKNTEFPLQPYSFPGVVINDYAGIPRDVFFEVTPLSDTGVTSIEVLESGVEYLSAPEVAIVGDGSGATAVANIVNGQVVSIDVTNEGINYTRATVQLTGGGGHGASATAILSESIGTIRSFYYLASGQKAILNPTVGTLNFATGLLTLNSILPISLDGNANYTENEFTFSAQPENDTIFPVKNQILDIDITDSSAIVVQMVPEL